MPTRTPRVLPCPIRNYSRAFWTRWRATSCLLWGVPGVSGLASIDRPGAAVPLGLAVQPSQTQHRPTGRGGSGSGCLLPVCNLSDIAPDRATLNPFFFLLYVDFWNMVFLEIENDVFWTFAVMVRNMPGELEKAGRHPSSCNR